MHFSSLVVACLATLTAGSPLYASTSLNGGSLRPRHLVTRELELKEALVSRKDENPSSSAAVQCTFLGGCKASSAASCSGTDCSGSSSRSSSRRLGYTIIKDAAGKIISIVKDTTTGLKDLVVRVADGTEVECGLLSCGAASESSSNNTSSSSTSTCTLLTGCTSGSATACETDDNEVDSTSSSVCGSSTNTSSSGTGGILGAGRKLIKRVGSMLAMSRP
ncbi:hypothetical protein MBLNU230_g6813t1 [Neophaeotheca triangularis]